MSAAEILRLEQVSKRYPGVRALKDVSLDVRRGEVHVIVGENGAGKSTLVKLLTGAERVETGSIHWEGKRVEHHDPHRARMMGIRCIYQELSLLDNLTVADNIFLGQEPRMRGPLALVNKRAARERTVALLSSLGVRITPDTGVAALGIAEKQLVEIAKALSREARLLILDEPTSALSENETEKLFKIIEGLKSRGIAIIYISHRLSEVFSIGDRVTVLKDGRLVGTEYVRGVDERRLIRMMVGKDLGRRIVRRRVRAGRELLRVDGLGREGLFEDISFSLHEGEIVGIAGLVGARRTDLARAIFGAGRIDAGTIHLEGKPMRIRSPHDSVRVGLGLLPEDRKLHGLVLALDLTDNISLASMAGVSRAGIIDKKKLLGRAEDSVLRLSIRASGLGQKAMYLSGGNQQKVVLAKWLLSKVKIFIFDEPTRGIDVGAKEEIYGLMNELTSGGAGIVMISSEIPEVLGMSDRIIVMHEGRITGVFPSGEATREKIAHCAFGHRAEDE